MMLWVFSLAHRSPKSVFTAGRDHKILSHKQFRASLDKTYGIMFVSFIPGERIFCSQITIKTINEKNSIFAIEICTGIFSFTASIELRKWGEWGNWFRCERKRKQFINFLRIPFFAFSESKLLSMYHSVRANGHSWMNHTIPYPAWSNICFYIIYFNYF